MKDNELKKVLLNSDDYIGNIYIFPGIGSHVLEFRNIAKKLAPDWNVVGIMYPAYTGDDRVYKSIPDLANYIYQKTDFKIENTVFIGHSFGGLVAYEISRIFNLKEQKIPIILLDSFVHNHKINQPFMIRFNCKLQKRLCQKYSLKKTITKIAKLKFLFKITKQKNNRMRSKKTQSIKKFNSNVNEFFYSYNPSYDSILIYLIKSDRYFFYNVLSDDYGWSQAGNVVYVSSSEGGHASLISKQNNVSLIKNLKNVLSNIIISNDVIN